MIMNCELEFVRRQSLAISRHYPDIRHGKTERNHETAAR